MTGQWKVTQDQLRLSRTTTPSGRIIEPLTLELEWVDGKLRIEIGGWHYMRQM